MIKILKLNKAQPMIGYLILGTIILFVANYVNKFYKKEDKLYEMFEATEKSMGVKLLYITDSSYMFYLFKKLDTYVINIDEEEKHGKFSKRLHKLSGNLVLIINFTKLDQQKAVPIIKALASYSSLQGNVLTTYVPYRAKESASLMALTGKNLIMGNFAVMTNTKIDPVLLKLLETYYGVSNTKKISESFYSEQNINSCYSSDDLSKMKINSVNEEKVSDKINKATKDNLIKLMDEIDKLFK
jgi:hypothetical protein